MTSLYARYLSHLLLAGCLAMLAINSAPLQRAQAATGIWTTIPGMNHARFGHTATLLASGQVLVVGGTMEVSIPTGEEDPEQQPVAQTAELYDPSTPETPWAFTASLTVPRVFHTATLIGDRVLVAGGTNGASTGGFASAEIYDPTGGPGGTPVWLQTSDMAQPHIGATATRLADGRVLVAGGYNGSLESGAAIPAVEIYDPVDGTWTPAGSMNQARVYHTTTLLPDGKVLVAGGSTAPMFGSGEILVSAEVYDPLTDEWASVSVLNQARSDHTATLLEDGTVLVAGGYYPVEGDDEPPPESYLTSAEIYNPGENTWITTGSMTMPRGYHTATILGSGPQQGKVLVAGGANSSSPVIMAELYDPAAGAWTNAGDLQDPYGHVSHTAALLADGRVLVAGGYLGLDQSGTFLADSFAELYTPKIPQTIQITTHAPASTLYNSTFTVAATATSGLAVTYRSGSPQICTNTGAEFTMVRGTGICIVVYEQAGDDTYDAAPPVVEHVAAEKSAQSIAFDLSGLEEKTFGDPPFSITAATDANLPISFTVADGAPCSISEVQHSGSQETTATVTIEGAGDCTITAGQGGDANYLAADPVSQVVEVAKASQTIVFEASGDRPYGTDYTVSARTDSRLEIAFEVGSGDPCSVTASGKDPVDPTLSFAILRPTGLGSCTITANQAGDADYNPAAPVDQTVTIVKGDQTIHVTASIPASARYLQIFSVAATATSGLPVVYSSDSPQVCIVDAGGTVTMLQVTGTCTVTLEQAGNDYYNPAQPVTQSISAMKALQTITFGPLAGRLTFGDGDVSVTVVSDSGLAVRVSLGEGDPCTLADGQLHILHAGACTLTAEQEGDDFYEAAVPITHTITIDKQTVSILLEGLTRTVDGKAKPVTITPAIGGLTLLVTYEGQGTTVYGPSPEAPVQVGTYLVIVTIDDVDYQGRASATLIIQPVMIYLPAVLR
jgi:N-acetylneuraminic acid mutarotase